MASARFFYPLPIQMSQPIIFNNFSLPVVYNGSLPSEFVFRCFSDNPFFNNGYWSYSGSEILKNLQSGKFSVVPFLDGLMLVSNVVPKMTTYPLIGTYNADYMSRLNDGAYHIFFNTGGDFSLLTSIERDLSFLSFSSLDEALLFIVSNSFDIESSSLISIIRVLSEDYSHWDGNIYRSQFTWENVFTSYGFFVYGYCCYVDFSLIVKALGGIPLFNQSQNLKMICELLGVDTNTSLDNCEAMKEYLKRIVQILGGSPLIEPNDNLKSICYLLGVDSNENGLTDCELSKDYVKRNSKMLGAE